MNQATLDAERRDEAWLEPERLLVRRARQTLEPAQEVLRQVQERRRQAEDWDSPEWDTLRGCVQGAVQILDVAWALLPEPKVAWPVSVEIAHLYRQAYALVGKRVAA
jgi:hypothetical protein